MRSEGKNHLNSIAYVHKQIDLKEASERKNVNSNYHSYCLHFNPINKHLRTELDFFCRIYRFIFGNSHLRLVKLR